MKLKEALAVIGSLSEPSKMPCYSWSISATLCKTGSKLRKIEGSVCSKCYALKGRYTMFKSVKDSLQRRYEGYKNPLWVQAMIAAISKQEQSGYFRWFDSGDLQDLGMLEKIVQIAKSLPNIKFWLPTREHHLVSRYVRKHGAFPENLTVRLSSFMLEGKPPFEIARKNGCVTSGVTKNSFTCPAPFQENKCLSCRACWDKNVVNVNYKQH